VAPSASALAAKRLAALQGAPGANDAEFFVPNTPGATGSEPFGGGGDGSGNGKDPKANEIMYAATERGLSIGDESGRSFGQNRMESAQLDLTHDEAKALYREKKNNLVWDRKKKNFVNTDGLKANDNRLSAKEGGLGRGLGKKKKKEASGLYEKWQAKTKTRIQLPGEGESRNKKVSVMADRGYGLGAARGGRDKWKSGAAVAAQKQTSGGSWKGAAGADGGHNLTKKVSGRRVDKTVTGSGGGVGGSELRDKDQIRKARVSVEKNKLKQMSKKNRGNALKAKGIKGGKEKGHFEAYR
jgi:ATP-dependent RNA helicase DDX54/DBP10